MKNEDHITLLQNYFEDLLKIMFSTIQSIQNDAGVTPSQDSNQIQYDQLPTLAENIVEKVADIDKLIDRTYKETFLGKETSEIKELLLEMTVQYEKDVMELSDKCKQAEQWIGKIHQMLGVIANNTPWITVSFNDSDKKNSWKK